MVSRELCGYKITMFLRVIERQMIYDAYYDRTF